MSLKNNPDFLQNIFRIDMNSEDRRSYGFKTFRLDVAERQLLNSDTIVPLAPKAFDVLVMLVERSGHLIEKEELMQSVWAETFVEEANLTRVIHTLRRALGEDNNGNKFISTVAKKGYRFVAEVSLDADPTGKSDKERKTFDADSDVWPAELEEPTDNPPVASSRAHLQDQWKPSRFLLAVLAISVFLIVGSYFALTWATAKTVVNESPLAIVILPFRPLDISSRDEAYDLFFADSLITHLSQAENLRVRQLSSIRGYTDVGQDAVTIGREQKADYVLESNYLAAGGQLRVTAKLLSVANGSVVEVYSYKQDNADPFAAADNIAEQLGQKLLSKLRFGPHERIPNRGTANELAWRHYVQGMNLTNKRRREDSDKAINEFEKAVEIDPKFADAYVGLAFAHTTSYINGGERIEHCAKTLSAAERALELVPTLAEAFTTKAMNALSCQGNRTEADMLHRRALELAPNSPFVRRFYGIYLTAMGKGDESIAELKAAIALEPNLPWNEKLLGRAYFFARRYEEAIDQLVKTRDLDRNDDEQAAYLFKSYEMKGDLEKAFEWFLIYESNREAGAADLDSYRDVYARSGWQGVLRLRMERAEQKVKNGGQNFGEIATLAAQLGETDKAFAYLEKALPVGQLFMAQILVEPTLDSLRSDPRFDAIIARNWVR